MNENIVEKPFNVRSANDGVTVHCESEIVQEFPAGTSVPCARKLNNKYAVIGFENFKDIPQGYYLFRMHENKWKSYNGDTVYKTISVSRNGMVTARRIDTGAELSFQSRLPIPPINLYFPQPDKKTSKVETGTVRENPPLDAETQNNHMENPESPLIKSLKYEVTTIDFRLSQIPLGDQTKMAKVKEYIERRELLINQLAGLGINVRNP